MVSRTDRRAMKRVIAQMRGESPASREHVDRVLREEGFESAAQTAAYHCQRRVLTLRPWQCPPCWANDEIDPTQHDRVGNKADEVGLRQRLQRAGVSAFEPDPMRALAEVEARSTQI